MADIKKRKISEKDWDAVEKQIKQIYDDRKNSTFRQDHERIWKEVDRQIAMKPMQRYDSTGKQIDMKKDWRAALELGDLAEASEIIADDVMRIIFEQDNWFVAHTEMQWPTGENGAPKMDTKAQEVADGLLQSMMIQQHQDFGLKARFRLSVKEALHHGSFVAEARFEEQMMIRDGDKIKKVGSPVWVPYSMWNAYPDPSPSVIGTNLFYTGSMVLVEYMPWHKLKQQTGEGWIQSRLKKVEKRENKNMDDDTQDVELVKYKGDFTIERGGDDIYYPNSEVILANDKIVFYKPMDMPYPNVIFAGYERQDVRDPYYTSPIIKTSPMHRMTTIMANKFIDAVGLKVEPPIEYDANDPDYVQSGGPVIAPGAKSATRSMGKGMSALDIGDPRFALDAFTLGRQALKEGLGVSANRAGVRDADRETATSANLANQGAEVRTMGFIAQLEPQALLPFLYMQYELNRQQMGDYTFYNAEMHTPDFVTANKDMLKEDAHFDVVGSKGILGEEKRARKIGETVAFFLGNPMTAPKVKLDPVMLEMFNDAGKKNAEDWVNTEEQNKPQIPPELMQKVQEMQQMLQQVTQENTQLKSKHDEAIKKIQLDAEKVKVDQDQFAKQLAFDREQFTKEFALKIAEFKADVKQAKMDHTLAMAGHLNESMNADRDHERSMEEMNKPDTQQ